MLPPRSWPKKKFCPSTIPRARSWPRMMRSKNSPAVSPSSAAIGRIGHDGIDSQFVQQARLVLGPTQRRRGLLGTQEPGRVRIEGENDGADALPPGHLQEPLDNAGVTPVHAVEISDRHDAAAKSFRQVVQVTVEDRHRFTRRDRAPPAPSPWCCGRWPARSSAVRPRRRCWPPRAARDGDRAG